MTKLGMEKVRNLKKNKLILQVVKKDRRVFPHLIRLPSSQRNHRSPLYTVMGKTLQEAKLEIHRQPFLSGTVLT